MVDEFAELFGDWLTGVVQLEPFEGSGFNGDTFGTQQPVTGVLIDETARLVRNSDGNEVVSSVTLYAPDTVTPFNLHDRVTVGGRVTVVVAVASPEVYGLFNFKVVNLA